MRRLREHLLACWYGGRPPGLALRLLGRLWGGLMALRRGLYRRGLLARPALPIPVLVVGNRSVGGAGKTPVVIALAPALAARGWRVGVVSRGHGRRTHGPVRVAAGMAAEHCGDEPLLIHRETGLPVEVDVDRVAAVRRLAAAGCTLAIADDGLQHLRLRRRVELEVEDGRGLGNGRVLPAGPLREPLPALPAFARIVHGRPPCAGEVALQLALGEARALDGSACRPLSAFAGRRVRAVAGIGDPERFFAALRGVGLDVEACPFPDHHAYRPADFAALTGLPLLMTAKDAVKCRDFGLADAWEVPLRATLPETFLDRLDAALRAPHADAPA